MLVSLSIVTFNTRITLETHTLETYKRECITGQKYQIYTLFFYKQWVYKHTEPQIMDFQSISLSIFQASDLPWAKFIGNSVRFVPEIEPNYDPFLSFVLG